MLVAANVTATLVRFLLLRSWVFPQRGMTRTPADAQPLVAGPYPRTTR